MAVFDVVFFGVAFVIMAASYYFLFGNKKSVKKQ